MTPALDASSFVAQILLLLPLDRANFSGDMEN